MKTDLRLLSKLGPRAVYGQTVLSLAQDNASIIAMSADLGNSSGLDRMRKQLPNQFINVGISEQSLVLVAAGMAREGFEVFASSFAPFLTMRALEMVRMNMGYMKEPVKLVGLGSGLGMAFLGNSHFGLEDIAVMRTIPNMRILSPADCYEVALAVTQSIGSGPTYIRLTGVPNMPMVHSEPCGRDLSVPETYLEGSDVMIVATGSMVAPSKMAADHLGSSGIDACVINLSQLKPIPNEFIELLSRTSALIVTVEEHSIVGGLFTIVSEILTLTSSIRRVVPLALPDTFSITASYEHLLKHHGLTSDQIVKRILEELKSDA